MPDEPLFKVSEVAERLRVNPETVRVWLRSGRIHGSLLADRIGWRIPASEVDRLLRQAGAQATWPRLGDRLPVFEAAFGQWSPCDRDGIMGRRFHHDGATYAVLFEEGHGWGVRCDYDGAVPSTAERNAHAQRFIPRGLGKGGLVEPLDIEELPDGRGWIVASGPRRNAYIATLRAATPAPQ
jgi:excisionase family DNA binding protein